MTTPRKYQKVDAEAVVISFPQLYRDRWNGRSHMFVERLLKNDPTFPRPFKIGRTRFWKLSEIEDYERQCIARRVERVSA